VTNVHLACSATPDLLEQDVYKKNIFCAEYGLYGTVFLSIELLGKADRVTAQI
jgi:hypothetical protein